MGKNYYLSPVEQELLDIADGLDIIFTEDIIHASGMGEQVVRNALYSLNRKGYIFRIKRGVYLRAIDSKPVIYDKEKIALAIFNGYIAFASALQHWGLIEYESFDVFVATFKRSGDRAIGQYRFKAVSMGRRARGATYHDGVYVSTLEKTMFDCLYKPQHAGGYSLVAQAIADANPDWKEVDRLLQTLGSAALRQRAGYVLSKAGNAPKWLLNKLGKGIEHEAWLYPSGERKGVHVAEWKVMDNGVT